MTYKHQNFVRLAEARVNKALESIRLIGNLTNRNNYEYSQEEARAIINALNAAISELKAQFSRSESDAPQSFRLPKVGP